MVRPELLSAAFLSLQLLGCAGAQPGADGPIPIDAGTSVVDAAQFVDGLVAEPDAGIDDAGGPEAEVAAEAEVEALLGVVATWKQKSYRGKNSGRDDEEMLAAAGALGAYPRPEVVAALIGLFCSGSWRNDDAATRALAKIGEPAFEALTEMLDHERDCYREVAAKALGRTGHAPFAVRLVEMLPDADRDVRREARGAAAHLYYIAERDGTSFPDVGPRLLELMEHQQPGTRAAAALLIGEIQYAKALEPLCRMLETDEDEDVRDAALRGLAHLEDPSSVDAVIGALEEKDPIMREIAAELLGELGDKRAVKPLAKLLRDKVGDVRIDAAQALAELPDPSVTAQLIRALGDDEHMVVSAAELALTRIGEPALPKLIAAYKRSRPSSHKRYLLLVLIGEHWDKRAVMTLISALGDRDRDVADLAFRILRNMACEDLGRKPGPWKRWWKEHGHAKPQGKCMKFYDLESVM